MTSVLVGIAITIFVLTVVAMPIIFIIQRRRLAANSDTGGTTPRRRIKEQLRLGYRYDSGPGESVFISYNTVWTGIRIPPVNDVFLTHDEMESYARRAVDALRAISHENDPVQVQYRLTHRPPTVTEWLNQLLTARAIWNPTKAYIDYCQRIAEYLRLMKTPAPTGYLLVQIAQLDQSTLERVRTAADAVLTGESDEYIPPDLAADWKARANAAITALRPLGPVTPITRHDRMWLIRRPLTGHYAPNMEDFPTTKEWGHGEFGLWVDFHADNLRHSIRIHLLNDQVHPADRESQPQLESFTAFLVAANWPDEADTGTPWMKFCATHELEVSYRIELIPRRRFLSDMTKVKNNIDDEIKSMTKGGRTADDLVLEEQALAEQAVNDIRRSRAPGMRTQLVIQVSAPTLDELQQRVDAVTREVSQKVHDDIVLVRQRRYQYRLLESMLPGRSPDLSSKLTPHVRLTVPEMFGIGFPRNGVVVGDRVGTKNGWVGDFIGWSDNLPVFFSPHSSVARAAGAGVLVVGGTGGGKTNGALLKFWQLSESGAQCRAIDPKVDFAQFCYYLAFGPQVNDPDFHKEARIGRLGTPESKFRPTNVEFWNDTLIIDVLSANAGVLDVWQVTGDINGGKLLGQDVLRMFLGANRYEEDDIIYIDAMEKAIDEYHAALTARTNELLDQYPDPESAEDAARADVPLPTMWQVAQNVLDHGEQVRAELADNKTTPEDLKSARRAATRIKNLIKLPYATLVFAENPSQLKGIASKRRVVFTLRGISLPSADISEDRWGERDRLASAIMYILVSMNSTLLDNSPTVHPLTGQHGVSRPRALFVDESYAITAVSEGRELLKTALAQGRSYNNVLFLMDQLASRLAQIESRTDGADGPSGNQVQTVMAFMQRSEETAKTVSPLLTTKNEALVTNALLPMELGGFLKTGRCLFRDMDFNLAPVDVDLMFAELKRAADTTPSTRAESQSHPVSSDINQWTLDYLAIDDSDPTPPLPTINLSDPPDEDETLLEEALARAGEQKSAESH